MKHNNTIHGADAVAVVKALESIEELDLRGARIGGHLEELEQLSRLTSPKQLHLSDNVKVDNLAPLSVLTQLEELSVVACRGADWNPLSNMKKPRYLKQGG